KLLNATEQDLRQLEMREKELNKLMKENEKLKIEMEGLIHRERHLQQVELLKHQNKISEDRIAWLKEMERKLRQIVLDWRKAEDKNEVFKHLHALLFKQKEKQVTEKVRKKIAAKYTEVSGSAQVGNKVMMKKNHQVGTVKEIRGKKAIVQVGLVPITVDIADLTVVQDKPQEENAG
ncbi:MAG TPA: MutS2/Smr-associated SH3 domain-containing protein, partial [Puia sp.]|nr:MutS2/Smr-associated SH3 domain-containing protein [Puia sp.]